MESENSEGKKSVDTSSGSTLKRKASDTSTDESDSDSDVMEVRDTESESEVDEDCDDWDDYSRIVNIPVKEKIHGFHLMPTCVPEPTLSAKKAVPSLWDELRSNNFVEEFKSAWQNEAALRNDKVEIIVDPWKVCAISKLLEDDSILYEIRQEFYELLWNRRRMDLYDFHQSLDLKYVKSLYISALHSWLKKDVMPWVGDLFNVELKRVSATCSCYSDTDYLLVHDDQQEDRVIAFVLYMSDVDEWKKEWGGALQLFDRDEHGQPCKSKRDVFPKHNQLVLFPVSDTSYHQVMEVATKNFSRLSINGWFHGRTRSRNSVPYYRCPSSGLYSENSVPYLSLDIDLSTWIKSKYLQGDVTVQIRRYVEANSEISLVDFLQRERLTDVLHALQSNAITWKLTGPPNRYRYEVLDERFSPDIVTGFINLFKSREMFKLLHRYTELDIDKSGGSVRYELQRWSSGCYSLLSDYDWSKKKELDVILYFGCQDVVGGEIQYVSQEEEVQEALITVQPQNNTLNLVYRDSARITCFVSKHTLRPFYILLCSYSEGEGS